MAKAREFTVTRTLDNHQLGLSVLIESLKPGETVLFREVTDEKPGDVVEFEKILEEAIKLDEAEYIRFHSKAFEERSDLVAKRPDDFERGVKYGLAAIRKGKG